MTKKVYPVTDAKNLVRDKTVVREQTTDIAMGKKLLENEPGVEKKPVKVVAQPLGDRVIVKKLLEEQRGIIIIPHAQRENSSRGRIEAVGPGRFGEAMTVKVGDEVLFPQNGVLPIEIDGEEFLMMRESDILAIV